MGDLCQAQNSPFPKIYSSGTVQKHFKFINFSQSTNDEWEPYKLKVSKDVVRTFVDSFIDDFEEEYSIFCTSLKYD